MCAQTPPHTHVCVHAHTLAHAHLQTPDRQLPEKQSLPAPHAFQLGHRASHSGPPQSVDDSPPFLTPSLQLAGSAQRPPAQMPLAQSEAVAQPRPKAQRAVHAAPQSTSDSPPFFAPSAQVIAGWQRPLVQTRLTQSQVLAQSYGGA